MAPPLGAGAAFPAGLGCCCLPAAPAATAAALDAGAPLPLDEGLDLSPAGRAAAAEGAACP